MVAAISVTLGSGVFAVGTGTQPFLDIRRDILPPACEGHGDDAGGRPFAQPDGRAASEHPVQRGIMNIPAWEFARNAKSHLYVKSKLFIAGLTLVRCTPQPISIRSALVGWAKGRTLRR